MPCPVSSWQGISEINMHVHILLCSIHTMKGPYDIYGVEFRQHFEVLITSTVLPTILFELRTRYLLNESNTLKSKVN